MSKTITRSIHLVDRGTVKSLPSFLEDLNNLKSKTIRTQLWFRGLADEGHALKPSCARLYQYAGKTVTEFSPDVERKLLNRFSRYAFQLLGRKSGEWEVMFVARHYGLPVRLLDWTSSPLAALYFACCDDAEKSGTLWALAHSEGKDLDFNTLDLMNGDDKVTGPFTIFNGKNGEPRPAIKLIASLFNSPRIVAQQGWFTYHSIPSDAIKDCVGSVYSEECLDFSHLIKWSIPQGTKPQLLEHLHSAGIARRVLFPDLDGFAQGIWESQVLWHGR